MEIADGEHRALVWKALGKTEIQAYIVPKLNDDIKRRLARQTLNKLQGEHDIKLDADEMALIFEAGQLNNLAELIAQERESLENILTKHKGIQFQHEDNFDVDKALEDLVPTTQLGDIWQLGQHRLICADCTDKRSIDRLLEDKKIDLVVTSPPYDQIREYDGNSNFDYEVLIKILSEIVQTGGIIVWIIADQTLEGSESGTSFKQALRFKENGFNIHDTMIWAKSGFNNPSSNRYHQTFEYMFVFSNGKPKTFNPICDRENEKLGVTFHDHHRGTDGVLEYSGRTYTSAPFGMRYNVWDVFAQELTREPQPHAAPFPIQIPRDHIKSWSNEEDIILDPFLGSGSTLIACEQTNRICYGVEIDPHYVDVCCKRYEAYTNDKAILLPRGD